MRASRNAVLAAAMLAAGSAATAGSVPVVDGHAHDVLSIRNGSVDVAGLDDLAGRGVEVVVVPLPLERSRTPDLAGRIAREVGALRQAAAGGASFALPDEPGALLGGAGRGTVQILLAIEWFNDIFAGDPARAALYRSLGVRLIGLAEQDADGLFGRGTEAATLTGLGRRVVAALNDAGVVIDITHLSRPQKLAVIAASRAPVVASHSLARAVTPVDFNLPDDVITALAGRGGSVWVSFNRSDLLGSADEGRAVEVLLDHVDHLASRLGPGHVGIGSDLQAGGKYVPAALNEPDVFARIRRGLAARGHSQASIDGILGGNVLRALGTRP